MANSPSTPSDDRRAGHGSSNEHPKPPIKEFIASPNHSSRNGARIDKVVLHCTEAPLGSTLKEFQNPVGRQVSAHYVIDRNGDIYQMVEDSERANHCRGANEASIGIEHVGKDTDSLTGAQADASAALIRWLLEQYDIPREKVFGHDFTPGYNLPGGTSCPDKLFGPTHAQSTIVSWVDKNVFPTNSNVFRNMTKAEIQEIVIRHIQDFPYTEKVTMASPLGSFFKEQDDIDKQQNKPIRRVDLFLRDLKKDLGEIPVTRDDLLDPKMFPKVADLVAVITAELED